MAAHQEEVFLQPVMGEDGKIKKAFDTCGGSGWNLLFRNPTDDQVQYIPIEVALSIDGIHDIIPDEFLAIRPDSPEAINLAEVSSPCIDTNSASPNFLWTHAKTLLLLEERLSRESEFAKSNVGGKGKLWNRIAASITEKLKEPITGDKCDSKFRNLWKTYRENKDKAGKTGEAHITWRYFNVFDMVYGSKENVSPKPVHLGITPKPPTTPKTPATPKPSANKKNPPVLTPRQAYLLTRNNSLSKTALKPFPSCMTPPSPITPASTSKRSSQIQSLQNSTASDLFESSQPPSSSLDTHTPNVDELEEDADRPQTPDGEGLNEEDILDRIMMSDKGPKQLKEKVKKKPVSTKSVIESYLESRAKEKADKALERAEKRKLQEDHLKEIKRKNDLLERYLARMERNNNSH